MALPGMLHARVVRPPNQHGHLDGLEAEIELRLEGGHLVRDGSFLAVAHANEWTATQLAARIESAARWSSAQDLDTRDPWQLLLTNPRASLPVIDGAAVEEPVPSQPEPPTDSIATLSARFQRPFQMHASIGPSAALAHLEGERLTVWTHSQGIYPLRDCIAEALGRGPESVELIHAPGAGCYGHNGADDAAFDAALVACSLPGRPILLKWSRAYEHGWEPYGSAMLADISASLGPDGRVSMWSHETYSGSHRGRPQPGPDGAGPAGLLASRFRQHALLPPKPRPALGGTALHRNQDPIYDFPAPRIVKNLVYDLPLRTSALRSLGAFVNVFAIESFIDMLAAESGIDPITLRLRHLTDQRARKVVELAAERLGPPGQDGIGRGIGFARYKNAEAYAAVGMELSVGDDARIVLQRAVIAADAGEIIDRQGIQSPARGRIAAIGELHPLRRSLLRRPRGHVARLGELPDPWIRQCADDRGRAGRASR